MKPVEKETFLAEAIKVKKKLVGHPDMYVSQHIKDAHYHCLQFINVASHSPSIFHTLETLRFVSVSVVCTLPISGFSNHLPAKTRSISCDT